MEYKPFDPKAAHELQKLYGLIFGHRRSSQWTLVQGSPRLPLHARAEAVARQPASVVQMRSGRARILSFGMPEEIARRLKIVAASEGITVTDYCLQILVPHIERDFAKYEQ